jgi:PAS domain-containing protein
MPQHPVELILVRQLAGGLAVPVLLVDENGDTLYFNEPAERIFGRRFDDIDALTFKERTAVMAPRHEDGSSLPPDELPGMVAMRERRPVHAVFHLNGFDGRLRPVEATAIPLVSGGGQLLGAMVVLWIRPEGSSATVTSPS